MVELIEQCINRYNSKRRQETLNGSTIFGVDEEIRQHFFRTQKDILSYATIKSTKTN